MRTLKTINNKIQASGSSSVRHLSDRTCVGATISVYECVSAALRCSIIVDNALPLQGISYKGSEWMMATSQVGLRICRTMPVCIEAFAHCLGL
jgi:hypothetical protein